MIGSVRQHLRRRRYGVGSSLALLAGLATGWPQVAAAAQRAMQPPSVALSPEAKQLSEWIARTRDHEGAPFIIIDKKRTSVSVFETDASLRAHTTVLLGSALGDDSVPGIGTRPMAQILPSERTTPAGRFVAERGRNMQGEDVVWVDYDAAVSMHRVRTGNPVERRAERLATPTIDDNRISYGCINVPVAFFEGHIQPIFAQRRAVVYVLPDTKPFRAVFADAQSAATARDDAAIAPRTRAKDVVRRP
jgi:hypothetical protein